MKTSIIKKLFIFAFYLLLWALAAKLVNNDILLSDPVSVIKSLLINVTDASFYVIVFNSLLNIGRGALFAFLLGIFLGIISFLFPMVKDILSPFFHVIKSIPVASFVVLLLIWTGSLHLSFFISGLIVLPHAYISCLEGLYSANKELLMMAEVFEYSAFEKGIYIYAQSLYPFLVSALKVSLGLAWKSGVAAEVIGMTQFSLGERIYMSKIYLDTSNLFSWTFVVVILCFIFEKAVLFLFNKIYVTFPKYRVPGENIREGRRIKNSAEFKEDLKADKENGRGYYDFKDLSALYEDKVIFEGLNIRMERGEIYAVMAPSGRGKTTLLKKIYEREEANTTVCFQEDLLLEDFGPLVNILIGNRKLGQKEALLFLDKAGLSLEVNKRVRDYSGGMRRRVSLLRALLYDKELLLLDEPFKGLDEEMKRKMAGLILEYKNNKTIILVTHDLEEAELLSAKYLEIFE